MNEYGNGIYRIERRGYAHVYRVREGASVFGFLFGGISHGLFESLEEAREYVVKCEQARRFGWVEIERV